MLGRCDFKDGKPLISELAHAKCLKCKSAPLLVAVSMDTNPYSWNEFFNMDKENPSEPSLPQPLDTMYNHVGTNEEPKGLRFDSSNLLHLVQQVYMYFRGGVEGCGDEERDCKSTMMAAVGQHYCRVM